MLANFFNSETVKSQHMAQDSEGITAYWSYMAFKRE